MFSLILKDLLKFGLLGFIFLFKISESLDIFLDCINGNDNFSGNASFPFKTVTKLNSYLSSSGKGVSNVYLKRGCRFGGEGKYLSITNLKNAKITNYGDSSANYPIVDLSYEISSKNWILEDSERNIYKVFLNLSSEEDIGNVFVDESTNLFYSHYPYYGIKNYFYLTQNQPNPLVVPLPDSFMNDPVISNLEKSQIENAFTLFRGNAWTFYKAQIYNYSSSLKTFNVSLAFSNGQNSEVVTKGYGFFLMGKRWMLNYGEGMFYYNQTTSNLYIRLPANFSDLNPSSHVIRFTKVSQKYTPSLDISGSTNNGVILDGIEAQHSLYYGIRVTSSNITVQNCRMRFNQYGLLSYNAVNTKLINNTLLDQYYYGFVTYGNAFVENNTINRVSIDGALNTFFQSGNVMPGSCHQLSGNDSYVIHNRYLNCGYNGITCFQMNNTITRNFFQNTCLTLDDCGSVFFYFSGNNFINHNLFMNSMGNSYGTSTYPKETDTGQGQGYYNDNGSFNCSVEDNVIVNTKVGIMVHDTRFNSIKRNKVITPRYTALFVGEDALLGIPGFVRNNTIEENILMGKSYTLTGYGTLGNMNFFSKFDSNKYGNVMPSVNGNLSFLLTDSYASTTYTAASLEDWKKITKKLNGFESDLKSSIFPNSSLYSRVPYRLLNISRNLVSNSLSNSTQKFTGWQAWTPTQGKFNMTWNFKDNCLDVTLTNHSQNCLIAYSPVFNISVNTPYFLSFDLWLDSFNETKRSSGDTTEDILMNVRKANSDFGPVGVYSTVTATMNRTTFTYFFNGSMNYYPARFDLYLFVHNDHTDIIYKIANVNLTQIYNMSYQNQNKDWTVFSNDDFYTPKTFTGTAKNFCDFEGKILTSDLVVQPLNAEMLLNCFCNYDGVCNNHENAKTCREDGCIAFCGNGVCEDPEENSTNCPIDCFFDYFCNGTSHTDLNVCSGNGECLENSTCACKDKFYGEFCQFKKNEEGSGLIGTIIGSVVGGIVIIFFLLVLIAILVISVISLTVCLKKKEISNKSNTQMKETDL